MARTPNTDSTPATGTTRSTRRRGSAAPEAPAAPETTGNGITAEELQADSYTPGDLRKMVRTGSAATKKLAQAELDRRAKVAQEAARAKNRITVAPAVAAAAQQVVAAQQAAANAERDAVLAYLKDNPTASAPQVRDAVGVSYSKVRKHAEAAGHRFQAQDRTAARVLTPAEAKQLKAIEQKMGASLAVLARALKAYDAA